MNDLIRLNKEQIGSETDPFTVKRYKDFFKFFHSETKAVLDYGCNTGRGGVVLKELKKDLIIYGADIVSERLHRIPSKVYEKIIDLNVESLSNLGISFDVIVSGEVVEHIQFEELIYILKSLKGLLNENGRLLLTTPNPNYFLVKLGRDQVLKDPSHVNVMSIEFLKTLLEKLEFKNVMVSGSGRVSTILGTRFPIMNVYGSYLITAVK